jgi:dynein assembly factor with WDR repeat domains 1
MEKLSENREQKFSLFKVLKAHVLPLTNCCFNKNGDKFLTGSYDRTCKVWDTMTGKEQVSLEDHKNVVYTMAFNVPYGDRIVTGSFDRTAKIWNTNTGELLHTLKGHKMEIVCVNFDPNGILVATGSMD